MRGELDLGAINTAKATQVFFEGLNFQDVNSILESYLIDRPKRKPIFYILKNL